MPRVKKNKPDTTGIITSENNPDRLAVVTSPDALLRQRSRKKRFVVIAVIVVVIIGLGVGAYLLFWPEKKPAATNNQPTVDQTKVNKEYLDAVKNEKVAEGEDKTGLLYGQMAIMYAQKDYAATISFAKELLASPGHANDIDALMYLGNSYKAIGDTTAAKQAYQKVVTYYDAHPEEKKTITAEAHYKVAKEGTK